MKHFFYICQSICLSLIDDNKLQLISWKKYKIYIKPPSLRRAIIMIAQTYTNFIKVIVMSQACRYFSHQKVRNV